MLLQLHLHSPLNNWLQFIAQRQLDAETGNISVLGFGASYSRDFTVSIFLTQITHFVCLYTLMSAVFLCSVNYWCASFEPSNRIWSLLNRYWKTKIPLQWLSVDCSISSALAMEILQPWNEAWTCTSYTNSNCHFISYPQISFESDMTYWYIVGSEFPWLLINFNMLLQWHRMIVIMYQRLAMTWNKIRKFRVHNKIRKFRVYFKDHVDKYEWTLGSNYLSCLLLTTKIDGHHGL